MNWIAGMDIPSIAAMANQIKEVMAISEGHALTGFNSLLSTRNMPPKNGTLSIILIAADIWFSPVNY